MKIILRPYLILIWTLLALFVSGCVTDMDYENQFSETNSDEDITYPVYFRITAPIYSRAGETEEALSAENKIESLSLGFYNNTSSGLTLRKWITAEQDALDPNVFRVDYNAGVERLPEYVLAIANMRSDNGNEDPLTMKFTFAPSADPETMPMSNVRYFRGSEPVLFTSLTRENFTEGKVSEIFIERSLAKVTLSLTEDFKASPVTFIHGDSEVIMNLELKGWNITAVDNENYYVKDIEGLSSEREDLEGDEWIWNHDELTNAGGHYSGGNIIPFPVLHWAHSVNYDKNEFPDPDSQEKEEINYVSFNDIETGFALENSLYVPETTRRKEVFEVRNGLPMIVVAGRYISEENQLERTFYRRGKRIYYEEDITDYFGDLQQVIYKKENGELIKADEEELSKFTRITCPDASVIKQMKELNPEFDPGRSEVTLQIDPLAVLTEEYYYSDGSAIDFRDNETILKLNVALLSNCGMLEKYEEGSVVFMQPVKHLRPGDDKTGCFGLVRNHYYDVKLNSISGIGRGVADKNMKIAFMGDFDESEPPMLNIDLKVTSWIEEDPQIVDINEDK